MDIIIDLNSPSKISKIAELAAEMMAKGGKLTLSVSMPDHSVYSVMGPYLDWAGVIPSMAGFGKPAPEPETVHPTPAPTPAPAPASDLRDSRGTPYNPDLHAALTGRTAGRNDAGEWKMKRGVDRSAYEAWKAQHVTAPQQHATAPSPQSNGAVFTPTPPPVNPFAAPQPVLEDPGEAALSEYASRLTMAGILTPAYVNALLDEFRCDASVFLKDPATRAQIWARLKQLESANAG